MKAYQKKMRIQTFDGEFNHLEDRLVIQETELRNGPKDVHKGPLKVEVCLFEVQDIEDFKVYLDKIRGVVPLDKPRVKRPPKVKSDKAFNELFPERVKNVEDAKEFNTLLKDSGFIFTSFQLMADMDMPIAIPEGLSENDYRLCVRLIKKAKNPLNNKYDASVFVLVPFEGNQVKVVVLGEIALEKEVEGLDVKRIKIAKSLMTTFPAYMTLEDRRKFTIEKSALEADTNKPPSNFYKRWVHFVADANKGKGISFPRIEEIERPF